MRICLHGGISIILSWYQSALDYNQRKIALNHCTHTHSRTNAHTYMHAYTHQDRDIFDHLNKVTRYRAMCPKNEESSEVENFKLDILLDSPVCIGVITVIRSNLTYTVTALAYFGKYIEIISQTIESHWPSDAPLHQNVLNDFIMNI